MAQSDNTHVVVLGGGPGGYVAAFAAADLGLKVTLVDDEANPGGVCLYRGCIPSKALLHVAKLLTESQEAKAWGITFTKPKVDLDKLRGFKESVVKKLTGGVGQLTKARKVNHIQGWGTFKDDHTLSVAKASGGTEEVSFDACIIATGSHIATLPFIPESPRVMDSTSALDLPDIPKKLLVLGGGYIGAELATVYSAIGSKVSMVEVTDGLLPGVDRDLVRPLEARMKGQLENLWLKTKVTKVEDTGSAVKVTMEGGESGEKTFDRILVAVGRKPNTEGFGLENTGVKLDDHGFIKVNGDRRTSVEHIYAIGDVAGQPLLAHKASAEGRVAAEAISGKRVAFAPLALPAVVYTDPEIAWCGLTESEAKAQGKKVQVGKFPWAASGRAAAIGRSDGVTKLVVDPETKQVLGVGIAGAGAGELISEGVLAVEMCAVAEDVALTIHPHPTLSETVMEAAETIYGHSTHYFGR